MVVIDEPVAAIVALAKHCICRAFEDLCECCGHSGVPLPPAAHCCDCGEGHFGRAYLQVVRVYPVGSPFPAQPNESSRCGGTRLAVEFAVTIYRCVDTVDDNGDQPDCETTTKEMYRNVADMATVRRALLCCMRDEVDDNAGFQIMLLEQTPLNPQGGCGGTTTRAVATADASILRSDFLVGVDVL